MKQWRKATGYLKGFSQVFRASAWTISKIVFYSTLYFMLTLAFFIYVGIALNSLRRRTRAFRFPHTPLDPVQIDENHCVRIFNYGGTAFKDMLTEIDRAEHTIYLETYIFAGDALGKEIKRRLIAKAEQGVKVYIAFDGFGSVLMPFGFRRWPKIVTVKVYGPLYSYLSFLWLGTYVRDHRKLLVIDHKIAYLGGMNIGREYAITWRDTHARIDGPTAQEAALAFAELWNSRTRNRAKHLHPPVTIDPLDDHLIWMRESRPSKVLGRPSIRQTYMQAFRQAQNKILLTNPYLLPDRDMEQTLLEALMRGVRVEVIVPEKTNHQIVDILARPVYEKLLAAGGKLRLYEHTVIHSKTATIDDEWSTIGTANLDGRSLINHEINLFVRQREFASRMEVMFRDDLLNCRFPKPHEFDRPSRLRLILETLLTPLRRYV